ncbi:putative iron-dependent peroxidase [Mariprofundus ferrinatatus]|uniref:Putative iron-dependent peroxidase n=1 Tax=Mariprofundus ferrinatatus TaxID=1921087 RepID=A0A2K8L696_9PROT|nr:Dyp-type peroxidase [Mariprofundus ferrinatatus]ATX82850.1 putative iron-dependent peroxidase [Mariprofundus ferrinatatus]
MSYPQPGILADVPAQARYLTFDISDPSEISAALQQLARFADGEQVVIGIGRPVSDALGISIPELKSFPVIDAAKVDIPATQSALWCWLRGEDRGELVHISRKIIEILSGGFECISIIDGFRYDIGRDLTGYEDGTENPTDGDAIAAAIAADGSSFVAVQQWVHDLDDFLTRPEEEQDDTIGRRKSDNEEFDEAPETAHVKRVAQEDFDPEAFVVRRSMPWADAGHEGLVFVAFGKNFDAYTTLLTHMVGADDGKVDALFSFTTPVTGSFFWCPPMKGEKLDLSLLGIG